MKIRITIILLIAFHGLQAQTLTLSLAEAQTKALSKNKQAKISSLEVEKAESLVRETLAIGLPQVSATGEFQHFLDVPTTVLPDFISPTVYGVLIAEDLIPSANAPQAGFVPAQFGTEYNLSGSATLSQLLFSGSYLIGLQAARSYVGFAELEKLKSEMEIKEAVANAYHTVLVAEQNVRVLKASVSTLQSSLNEIQAMYEEGFVEEQDAEQLQLTLNNLQAQIANAERQEDLSRQLLNFQIGLPLESAVILNDDVESLSTLAMDQEEIALAEPMLLKHPDFMLLESSEKLGELQVREKKSQYWPTLGGFFSYSQQAQRNEFNFFDSNQDWFPTTVWGLNLNVPIFSSGMRSNQVKQKEIELEEVKLQKEMALDGLKMEAIKSRSDFLLAKQNYELAKENMSLAERIRDKTRIKYQEGLSSSFELNQMENQFLENQGQLIGATLSLLNSTIQLKKAFNTL